MPTTMLPPSEATMLPAGEAAPSVERETPATRHRRVPRVLVVDGDAAVLDGVQSTFRDTNIDVSTAKTAEEALAEFRDSLPDAVLMDVQPPNSTGLELLESIHQIDERIPIIFMASDADSDTAIKAMMSGAYDYVLKPLDSPNVKGVVQQAVATRRMMHVPVSIPNGRPAKDIGDVLVGRSPGMLEVYKAVGRVAAEDVTVLVCGESGTGKELIARAIYQHSPRSRRPFLAVNCAALPDTLLESELFGHEKGAFTGADQRRIGKFEQCHGGTIFLDEIGDMSPLVQSKVLRLLQEQRFERVGGNKTIETDVRIIAATNRDLEQMVEDGEFRSDLYYRLNGFTIQLPPVRDRGDDILLLLEHFLTRFAEKMERQTVDGISPDAVELLRQYSWPGNVRELQSVVKQALLNASGPVILPDCLPPEFREATEPSAAPAEQNDEFSCDLPNLVECGLQVENGTLYEDALTMMERYVLTRVLEHTAGNQSQAARILGITRGSLRNKIRQRGISLEQIVSVDG